MDYVFEEPLNKPLYNRLVRLFGEVQLANAGQEFVYRIRSGDSGKVDVVASGEYMRVNCPKCDDTRRRLWINHRYGTAMPTQKDDRYPRYWKHLIHCYNERCTDNPEVKDWLWEKICEHTNVTQRRFAVKAAPKDSRRLLSVDPPGTLMLVNTLNPTHPCRQYLERDRLFDVTYLADEFGIAHCLEADRRWPTMQGRLVIPIIMDQQLVGWQGRFIGEGNWKFIPKYWGLPGMPKSLMLYNWDRAKLSRLLIVVEGAPAVWAMGTEQSTALLGKSLTSPQMSRFRDWDRDHKHNCGLILMLDPDAQDEIQGTISDLHRLLGQRFANVVLPDGTDPADLDNEFVWDLIHAAAQRTGMPLPSYLGV